MHGEGPSNNTPKEGGHGKGHFFGRSPHHQTGLPNGNVVNAPGPQPPSVMPQPPASPPTNQGY